MWISRRELSSSVRFHTFSKIFCPEIFPKKFLRIFVGEIKNYIRDILSRVKDEIAAKEAEISELEKSMNEGLSLVEKVVEYENDFDSQVWLLTIVGQFLSEISCLRTGLSRTKYRRTTGLSQNKVQESSRCRKWSRRKYKKYSPISKFDSLPQNCWLFKMSERANERKNKIKWKNSNYYWRLSKNEVDMWCDCKK